MRLSLRILVVSCLFATAAGAQHYRQTRNGFTVGFGLGSGSAAFECDGCDSHRVHAPSVYFRMGGTVKPNLIIAGQIDAWTKSEDGVALTVGTLDAIVQWYPQPHGGFYVLGGLGFGSINTEIDTFGGRLTNNKSGIGYNVGTGYDIRVAKNFSLSPFASYFYTSAGESAYNASRDRVNAGVFHIGLGFTWH